MNNYTQEQTDDIKARQEKLISIFKELEMQPMIQSKKEAIAENVYADRLEIVLVDTKYLPKAEVKNEPVVAEKVETNE